MNSHIILAYDCDGKGGATSISDQLETPYEVTEGFTWVHLDANHPDAEPWLKSEIEHLDPYIIDALMADGTRPRMTKIRQGAILILRGANFNENAEPEDMISIRLWVEKNRIISIRRRKLMAVLDIEQELQNGTGPSDEGEFVSRLMQCLFKRIEPVLNELEDQTDAIEERVLEAVDTSLREEIVDVRKQAILFRRFMVPQRDAIDQLRMSRLNWLSEQHQRSLQENYNHVVRYVEDLDAVRERSQIIKDEIVNLLTDKLNKNMYMLSVISAIFLPLGFLTGLLGVNVGGLPGVENSNAFWIFTAMLIGVVILQYSVFKKLKWF